MYKKLAWEKYLDDLSPVYGFAEDYKSFISECKTERLVVKEVVKLLEEHGFKDATTVKSIKSGDKLYFTNKNKNIAAYIIGKKTLTEGVRILGAHIDSPRLDFKERPILEREGFVYGNTHYYGGIKKYQWVTIPLAIHGVVCLKDGSTIEVNVGEDEKDPVIGITDLLPHLARQQMQKPANNIIEGEDLDVSLGSLPLKEGDHKVKGYLLNLLKEKYGFDEEDFISSEIEITPAGKARDYGLDGSMILGYGHDDRSCAYTSLRALLDVAPSDYTSCCVLVDKEEVGSIGATGAQSHFFENSLVKLLELSGSKDTHADIITLFEHSRMLSSDVSAGFDPIYPSVSDKDNSALLGYGLTFNKYVGAGGKSSSNDANPEYYAWIRKIMDENNVNWQSAEIGKVDAGGGGTIAYILGNYNLDVIDAGIPVHNMHAPMEVVSKVDVYEAYLGYKAFLTK